MANWRSSEIERLIAEAALVTELAEAAQSLINEICAGEEHGEGATDDQCPICNSITVLSAALAAYDAQRAATL